MPDRKRPLDQNLDALSASARLGAAAKGKPGRGLSALGKIAAALSLGRIVLINLLALGVTAAVTAHVIQREARRKASLAAPAPSAATSTSAGSAQPIEVDFDRAEPVAVPTSAPRPGR